MEHQDQNIHSCAHCGGTGTCTHGKNGVACAACVEKNDLKPGLFSRNQDFTGLACGTCGGLGKTDMVTYRLNNRATPLLAFMIITFCFILIVMGLFVEKHFQEILTFSGTLIGSVVGYYFGGKSENRS